MRLVPMLTAIMVTAFLYFIVVERDDLLAFASASSAQNTTATTEIDPDITGEEQVKASDADALVRVVAIRSQATTIDSAVVLRGQTEAEFAQRCTRLPLGRPAALAEIAAALRFLIAAKSVTGQLLALDGGDHLATFKAGQPPLIPLRKAESAA